MKIKQSELDTYFKTISEPLENLPIELRELMNHTTCMFSPNALGFTIHPTLEVESEDKGESVTVRGISPSNEH